MALPAELARYDALLDLLVEALVCELLEAETGKENPDEVEVEQ